MKTMPIRTFSDDSGVALLTVVGVISVMTIMALGAYALGQNVLRDASVVNERTQAFQAANSAADIALARIQQNGFDASNYPITGTDSVGATYTATLAPTANSEFLCTATGTYRGLTERISIRFFYLNIWNMNIAAGNNALGGGSVRGTTSVYGPFYVRGGVALGSNSRIENGPLFIKNGDLTITGSGSVGERGAIDVYVSGAYPTNGSKGMNARTISQSVPDITLPLVDQTYIDGASAQARSESVDNVRGYSDSGIANLEATAGNAATYTTMNPPNGGGSWYGNAAITARRKAPGASTFYKCIGVDSGPSAVGAGTHPLTVGGTGSWGAWSGDGHYTLANTSDDFAYNDSTNVLYVHGTVFIDGPLELAEDITYKGNGTIVANGDITISGDFTPGSPTGESDPDHCVGLVTPNNVICNAGSNNNKEPTDPPNVMGAFFAGKDWSMSRNTVIKGSVLAGSITFGHSNEHLVTDPDLPSYLPRSMPGNGQAILTKGAWTR